MNPSSVSKTKVPFWLKFVGFVCFFGAFITLLLHFFSEDPGKIVENQLSSLRSKNVTEAYYAYTSSEFQAQTSLDKFQKFLKENPIFLNNTNTVIKDKIIEADKGSLLNLFYLNSEKVAEAIFSLVKENNAWKILGVEVVGADAPPPPDSSLTSDLIAPVERQLNAFQRNDILGGYKDLVSKTFQTRTPFDKFKAYVLQNPLLTQFKHYDFKEHSIEGTQGNVTVILNSDGESVAVKYKLLKENDAWKIELMKVIPPASTTEKAPNTAQMISFIEEMLAEFKQKNYDKVYQDFIADNIKKGTPLETFKKFIKNYSAFTNYQSMNIKEPLIEENVGHLIVDLYTEEGITSVEYSLKLVDTKWKIEGMHIVNVPLPTEKQGSESSGKNYKTRELLSVIQSFLKSLRLKEEENAYKQYTSQNFKSSNPFNDFQKFLKTHPELTSTSSTSFEKLMFNNNIATFSGKLFISDKFYLPIEFDLIQEDGQWKILNIFTYPPAEIIPEAKKDTDTAAPIPIEFTKIALGTSVDEEGNIENPSTNFHQNSGDLNMNLFLSHGVAGTKLQIVLRHVDSGSEIAPISTALNDNGETELSFVFSPPPKGWPKGSYQIRISSSTNVFKTFPFTVD